MRKRKLGRTDLELTTVGLGTWAIGGVGYEFAWGPQDDEESVAAIRRAVEAGVNWIDTAPVYGVGHSEEVVGRAIEGIRDDVLVATKCGISWDSKGRIARDLTLRTVHEEIDDSLRRLGVDVIDLYQIHWPLPDEAIEKAWEEMLRVRDEGKARFVGVSNFGVEELRRIGRLEPPASLQPPYSMLRRDVEADVLPYCAGHGIGVVAYSPLQKGILTGAWTKERAAALPPDDHRRKNPWFKEPELSVNLELAQGLREVASKSRRTPAQLAVAWVLRDEAVTAAIVGSRRPSQIEETAAGGDWELAAGDVEAVEKLLARRLEALGKG